VTRDGRLAAMLGKELRNSLTNTWLNYAVPIAELQQAVEDIRMGISTAEGPPRPAEKPERPLDLEMLGIVLVPDVLARTPPYVDRVRPRSPAATVGLRPDDLIVLVNDRLIQTSKSLREELEYIDYEEQITVTVFRGQELLEVVLQALIENE
jgi:serine protease Do